MVCGAFLGVVASIPVIKRLAASNYFLSGSCIMYLRTLAHDSHFLVLPLFSFLFFFLSLSESLSNLYSFLFMSLQNDPCSPFSHICKTTATLTTLLLAPLIPFLSCLKLLIIMRQPHFTDGNFRPGHAEVYTHV